MFPECKILNVNLTTRQIIVETLPKEIYRKYPGGSALATYLILKNVPPKIEPLSDKNVLVFAVSPLTGLPISGISRVVVGAKSPLTGAIGDSQAGGYFPVSLKANGYDAIMFTGKSESPVYLYIDGENIELKDAKKVWGNETRRSEELIKEELNDNRLDIAQIGPGGENLVKYACILNMCTRANGRTGMGAVMGSKNLKAVVLKKKTKVKIHNKEEMLSLAKEATGRIKANEAIAGLALHGTDGDLEAFSDDGFLPTRNWQSGYFPEGAHATTGETMSETILKERDTCFACAIRCKRVVEVEGKVDPFYGGPEYETCATFGSYCGVTDLSDVALANQLCNMYGLDTISCGATISFAMECFEKGLIDEEYTGGLKLEFGDGAMVCKLVEMIVKKEGFGKILAEGSLKAAKEIGKGAEEFSISVKGQELPAHMPQYKPAVGLVYAVNPFGADHQSSEHDPFLIMPEDSQERRWIGKLGVTKEYEDQFTIDYDKVRFAFDSQCFFSMLDTLCLCQFVWGPSWELYGPDDIVKLCKYGLDWDTSVFELMRIGERRINMMRVFNAREGFTKDQDKLPERVFKAFKDGPSKGAKLDKEKFLWAQDKYYDVACWDKETGNPTNSILTRLSLDWLIDEK
jgi:aldehyde:ferredoxin oxidoreductase